MPRIKRKVKNKEEEEEGQEDKNKIINWYSKLPSYLLPHVSNPNYDQHKISLPCRIVCVGASGSGKTRLVVQTIYMMPKTFTNIIVCCANANEPLYNYLRIKIPEDQLTICEGIENIPDLNSLPHDEGDHTLIVFDDLVNEKNQKKICDTFIRGRKIPVSMIYCSQSYYQTPKMIRVNSSHVWLVKLSTIKDLRLVLGEFDLGLGQHQLLQMYNKCVENQSFLNIAVADDASERFRMGFTDVLPYETTI